MDKDEAIELIKLAIDTIEGLADQQAMSDDWYISPLSILRDRLEKLENGQV